MTLKKYGKSSLALLDIKKSFVNENNYYVKRQNQIAKLYSKQKKRLLCKNCNSKKLSFLFSKFNTKIKYFECLNCGHLNGEYEDSENFCVNLYTLNKGTKYAKNYVTETKKSYFDRVKAIYIPKSIFLKNSLKNNKISTLHILDIGCGSGYFVSSLAKVGFKKIDGIDVSKKQINFGNKVNNFNLLNTIEPNEVSDYVHNTKAKIVSLIGVLEHVQNPSELLSTIKKNRNIEYIYMSVPLFSLTVYMELIFHDVYNRHLSGAHTHLYTEKSINWLMKKYGFKTISEWWFGLDVNDLFRNAHVKMKKEKISKRFLEKYNSLIRNLIDDFQYCLDKKKLSSEIHILMKKK